MQLKGRSRWWGAAARRRPSAWRTPLFIKELPANLASRVLLRPGETGMRTTSRRSTPRHAGLARRGVLIGS